MGCYSTHYTELCNQFLQSIPLDIGHQLGHIHHQKEESKFFDIPAIHSVPSPNPSEIAKQGSSCVSQPCASPN